MTRVLRVITTIEPDVGGPSHSTLSSCDAETRFGGACTTLVHTVPAGTAVTRQDRARIPEGVVALPFDRVRLFGDASRRWGLSMSLLVWLARNLRRYDVVHVEYVWSLGTIASAILGRGLGVPVVLTPHESLTTFGLRTSRSTRRERQKRLVGDLLLRAIDRVVFTSQMEADDSGVGDQKEVVVPLPIAMPELVTVPVREESPGHPLRIGFLGRLHAKKKLQWLIEEIRDLGPDYVLIVGGSEPPEELRRLQKLCGELGMADRVQFLGFVEPELRDRFFAQIDVLAMPSEYECFGMVAAEAMASGLPVVVSDRTGVHSVVSDYDAGFVIEVEDGLRLRAALRALRADPQGRRRLGENARQAAQKAFSFQAYGASIGGLYAQLASSAN